jgi:hypothetical protein
MTDKTDPATVPHTPAELAELREMGVTLPQDLSEAAAEDTANEQHNASQTTQANSDARREDAQHALDSLAERLADWLRRQPEVYGVGERGDVDDLGSGIYGFTVADGPTRADVSLVIQLTSDQQF